MRYFLLIAGIVVLISSCESAGIIKIGVSDLENKINTFPKLLVFVSSDECIEGGCDEQNGFFKAVANKLQSISPELQLAVLYVAEKGAFAKENRIRRLPAGLLYVRGKKENFYYSTSEEHVTRVVKTALKALSPPAIKIEDEETLKYLALGGLETSVIGYFSDLDSQKTKTYLQAVAGINPNLVFAYSDKAFVGKLLNIPRDSVAISSFGHSREQEVVFSTNFNEEDLKTWILLRTVDYLPQRDKTTHILRDQSVRKKITTITLSYNTMNRDVGMAQRSLLQVAKELRGKVLFSVSSGVNVPDDEKVPGQEFSLVGVNNARFKEKSVFKYEVDADNIKKFVNQVILGTSPDKVIKAEPLPTDWDKGTIKTLVRGNVENVALDQTKDVLLKIFSPKCGACVAVKEAYEEVAAHFATRKDVLVGEINVMLNDVPPRFEYSGVPTFFLITKLNQVIKFEGELSDVKDNLIAFVESSGNIQGPPPASSDKDAETKLAAFLARTSGKDEL